MVELLTESNLLFVPSLRGCKATAAISTKNQLVLFVLRSFNEAGSTSKDLILNHLLNLFQHDFRLYSFLLSFRNFLSVISSRRREISLLSSTSSDITELALRSPSLYSLSPLRERVRVREKIHFCLSFFLPTISQFLISQKSPLPLPSINSVEYTGRRWEAVEGVYVSLFMCGFPYPTPQYNCRRYERVEK